MIQWCTLPRLLTMTASLLQLAYSSPGLVTQSLTITLTSCGQSSGQQSTSTHFWARQTQFLTLYSQEKSSLKPELAAVVQICNPSSPEVLVFKGNLAYSEILSKETNSNVHSSRYNCA